MTEVFDRAGVSQPAGGLRRPPAVAALRPDRGSGALTTVMIAAAAGLVGLGAGALVIRAPALAARTEARVAVQSPVKSQPQRPTPAAPPIVLAQAAPAPLSAKTAEAVPGGRVYADQPSIKVAPAHTPAKLGPGSRARFRAKLARLGDARPASARNTIRLPEPRPVAQPASCEQDSAGDDCRRAVIQADRHLRAVYQSAIERGVGRSTLVDYRDRWADLRDRQTEDPTRLIESYGALAYDLGRETSDSNDQDDAARPRGRSGLRALADLLLPWR
ncbi:MAG TPA: hypothetical protein VGM25_17215 [Caulobacteraceae bacterium]